MSTGRLEGSSAPSTSDDDWQGIKEVKAPGINWLAVLAGSLIMFLGYYILYNEVRPAEDEYVAGYIVAFIGLLLPAFVAGIVAGSIAKRSPAVHASASVVLLVLGGYLVRFLAVFVTIDLVSELRLSTLTVFGVAWGVAAPLGGSLVGMRLYKNRRELEAAETAALKRHDDGDALLVVDDLTMHYKTQFGWVSAVDDVSFSLKQGESLGLVGESGCGKTSIAMSLLRLIAENGHYKKGEIRLEGVDLLKLSPEDMRRRRWSDISMVFQGAMNAWNPVYTVHDQIREAMDIHLPELLSNEEVRERIAELFEMVGLDPAMMDRFPHEFSGGMRQRAVIAMALSCNPKVIIADEPTTALDVIVQDQILEELKKIQRDLGMSIIYISHDIAVIAEVTDKMGVMYAGRLVEFGSTVDVFARPKHPYAYLLLGSTPSITGERRKLSPLDGEPPNLLDPPTGCRFHPRCPFATQQCVDEDPVLTEIEEGHSVACWNWRDVPVEIGERVR